MNEIIENLIVCKIYSFIYPTAVSGKWQVRMDFAFVRAESVKFLGIALDKLVGKWK